MKLVGRKNSLNGKIVVPGDKSISHRSVMFGAIAEGTTKVSNFLLGEDCLSTIACFQKLGVKIEQSGNDVKIYGKGLHNLQEPKEVLDVGNSGTTIRLMLGILANTPFHSTIIGDTSIGNRPMKRVTEPLSMMNAQIDGRENGQYTPLSIRGGKVKGMHYHSPVASAQVKSAVLLAGLQGEGVTTVTEPMQSRDHTERMLRAFGCTVDVNERTVSLQGGQQLKGADIEVPGDVSSAAFFLVAGAIVQNSKLVLENVGLNPTRTGILDVLTKMGALISIDNMRNEEFEPCGDITIETSKLKGIEIGGSLIPRLIDEIPVIALLATQAEGITVIKDAEELKVKETNRIDTVVDELGKLGAKIEATPDGMIIYGKQNLKGNTVNSHGDHRIGMMLAIASCIIDGEVKIENSDAVAVSYPNFFEQLAAL
ncbi:3-phosphoshikimate 1-carboxyvinyltransferase [Bacillus nitratireducens]|uniref:3-phosphoshikimate 1-carboxyvinyltransferase n=1 Tax=Bacillus nitratireducens TaxID=2026193 RepID=UPI00032E4293|nr:3-phosphoshikimate 1-carboxyvinyltransferase [Bacillus nitratireducens]EOP57009.1 3-phosphoshikimate 1-carboxyvinyltransferase [Bacillus cereus VDM053]PEB82565.1 3-phosphoshikimate 1-carboxyvinyltransferase [Bacillus cereus]OJD52574.1 3-phosphoshikimate 1-carboxyvinyltransferase [Bacillus nitratireducens]PFH76524.1 3-phosphoshikimate 1-carboxyvinyltransferase [Bacillus cereus]SDZ91845.1 3-phosphoshikimate 1-carboxyvinyltransferase [Bacillus nitratireducens]